MITSPPSLRYERKFLAPVRSVDEVLALVHRHPALFREAYPPRVINNVYLDSPALDDYQAHVQGTPNRAKTRIRWYGELHGPIASPRLERKTKRGQVSGKQSHALPALSLNGSLQRADLAACLQGAELPGLLRLDLARLEPTLINRYQRRYFLSGDRRFRLTVDWDLEFLPPFHPNGSPHASAFHRHTGVILELKFATEAAEFADPITNAWPFRVVRCSKYILGIEQLAWLRGQMAATTSPT